MSEFKYEIGDEFLTRHYREVLKVKDRAMSRHGACYWMLDCEGSPSTVMESTLDRCTKIEPFFKVGDTFTSPFDSATTMTVTHVDTELRSAWVTVATEGESSKKETVTDVTWRHVKGEVLRNRNA